MCVVYIVRNATDRREAMQERPQVCVYVCIARELESETGEWSKREREREKKKRKRREVTEVAVDLVVG